MTKSARALKSELTRCNKHLKQLHNELVTRPPATWSSCRAKDQALLTDIRQTQSACRELQARIALLNDNGTSTISPAKPA